MLCWMNKFICAISSIYLLILVHMFTMLYNALHGSSPWWGGAPGSAPCSGPHSPKMGFGAMGWGDPMRPWVREALISILSPIHLLCDFRRNFTLVRISFLPQWCKCLSWTMGMRISFLNVCGILWKFLHMAGTQRISAILFFPFSVF